jgi:hypothetical protein
MVDSSNRTIVYNGIVNTMAVLNYVVSQQKMIDAYLSETLSQVLVSGFSAGAVAAPIWLGQIATMVSAGYSYVVLADMQSGSEHVSSVPV